MRSNKTFLLLADLALLNLTLLASFNFGNEIPVNPHANAYLIVFSNLAWVFLVLVTLPYHFSRSWELSRLLSNQASFLFVHLMLIASLAVLFDQRLNYSRLTFFYVAFIVLFFAYRILFLFVLRLVASEQKTINYLLMGRNEQAIQIRRYYLSRPDLGYRFVSFVDIDNSTLPFDKLKRLVDHHDIHEIIWCVPDTRPSTLPQLVQFGLNSLIRVRIILTNPHDQVSYFANAGVESVASVARTAFRIDESFSLLLKRTFDLCFTVLVFLLFFSWLFPVIALLIKIESKGPVFFVQRRNGLGNRPFSCYKFRSMVVNEESDLKQATKSDPRITRLGAFLRRSSIDELPQFINVLKGDMSVIGPRPHPIKLNEKFQPFITHIMSRHYVKPGITGLAQCMGYRGETQTVQDMENRVRLDRYYIENWSFWLDIKIIFLTVVSLIRGSDKAY